MTKLYKVTRIIKKQLGSDKSCYECFGILESGRRICFGIYGIKFKRSKSGYAYRSEEDGLEYWQFIPTRTAKRWRIKGVV